MRLFVVVFLLGLLFCGCALAQTKEQTPAPPASNSSVRTFTFTLPNHSGSSAIQNAPVYRNPEWLPGLSLNPNSPMVATNVFPYLNAFVPGEPSCFKMRTYIVRQESADSDATVPSGYSECMSAARLKLKTVAPGQPK